MSANPLTPRRARTHTRLVEAATKVVARRGFHAATVDEIAGEAGYSVGALYSNFSGKDELFLAVFDGHIRWFEARLEQTAGAEDTGAALHEALDGLAGDPDQFLIFIEFWAYAVRRPELRERFGERMRDLRVAMAEAIRRRAVAGGAEPALPPETLALVLLALTRGLGIEKLADPDAVDETVARVIAGLAS